MILDVVKETFIFFWIKLNFLLRKSLQSEVWMNWALQITELYNKCRKPLMDSTENGSPKLPDEQMNANICSNMYPALLLPYKRVDFTCVLQVRAIK